MNDVSTSFWDSLSFWPKSWKFGGAVGCSSKPEPNPVCLSDSTPKLSTDNINASSDPEKPGKADYEKGVKVTWKPESQPLVTNCDGSTANVKLTCKFEDGNLEVVPDSNGNIIIEKTLHKKLSSSSVLCDVYSPLATESAKPQSIKLYAPGEANACYSIPEPGTAILTPDVSEVVNGDGTPFTWVVSNLTDCNGESLTLDSHNADTILHDPIINYDGANKTLTLTGQILSSIEGGSIKLTFKDRNENIKIITLYLPTIKPLELETSSNYIKQNVDVPFYLIRDPAGATNYRFTVTKPDGTVEPPVDQANSSHFNYTPGQAGLYNLKLEITTYSGEIITLLYPFTAHEAAGAASCYSVPEPGSANRIPDISEVVQGDGTAFTWTVTDLTDCNGGPLSLVSDNKNEILNNPSVAYNATTKILTVSGKILPTLDSGTIKLTFQDAAGNQKIINLYLPTIKPLELTTNSSYIKQNDDVPFYLIQEPAGATNFRFKVTKPDGTDSLASDLPNSAYSYKPDQVGLHILKLEITTYSGEKISIAYHFNVNEAGGATECYSIPDPGASTRTPAASEVPKGDGTQFTWTVNDITDCNGDALTLVSNNTTEILNNPNVAYDAAAKTLTVTGKILPTLDSGTVQVQFNDAAGNQKIVTLYLPTIKPLELETSSNYIQQNDEVPFYLMQEPAGATKYRFTVSKPDGTSETPIEQTSSLFKYKPGQAGNHNLKLEITTYSGEIITLLYSFNVHEAAGASACFSVPEPGAATRTPSTPEVVKGDGTLFTWVVSDLTDCNGNALTLDPDNNATEILNSPNVAYDAANKTLTISGRILPTIESGTVKLAFHDADGNPKIINLYLPTIKPLELETSSSYINQNDEVPLFLTREPAGATNYRFTVTKPDGTSNNPVNQANSHFNYTPAQAGLYNVKLEIATYSGETITLNYPFISHEVAGGANCYSVPDPGAAIRTPNTAEIVKGDGTSFTWTVADLADCNGDPLTLDSNNADDILFNPNIAYSATTTTLTVSGKVLPTIDSGAIQFKFKDAAANSKVINLYLPTIKPLKLATGDNFIQQNEPVLYFLEQAVPNATNYRFWVTKPGGANDPAANLSTPEYSYSSGQTGAHLLNLNVTAYNEQIIPTTYPFTVHEAAGASACYTIPDPGAATRTPNLPEIAKGDNTAFTWTINNLTDCNSGPLTLGNNNALSLLFNPSVNYNATTTALTVNGQVLPTVDGGSIRVQFLDGYGNVKTVNLYLPDINPLEIVTPSSYIQAGKPATFTLLQAPAGASNYRYWVTLPDGTNDIAVNQALPPYIYTPPQVGLNVLNLGVTAYNGSLLPATYPFVSNEGSATQSCYSVPDPGLFTQTPYLPQLVRGDNTPITWTVNGLTDCTGGPLSLFSNNASNILYNESVGYAGSTLTVSGRVRSDFAGGSSMRFTFIDGWGLTKIINIFPPSIVEPDIVITDPWITLSEDLTLQLLSEPAGCTYLYSITRPDTSVFNSGSLPTSAYLLSSGNKNQLGSYQINLNVTAADGKTFPVFGAFKVNENPTP